MPIIVATTSALALKPCVSTHYVRTNTNTSPVCNVFGCLKKVLVDRVKKVDVNKDDLKERYQIFPQLPLLNMAYGYSEQK